MSDELKNCPFCGGIAKTGYWEIVVDFDQNMVKDYYVVCERCNAVIGGDGKTSTEKQAIQVWNNRPIEDALHGIIDGQKVIISELEQQLAELRKANEVLEQDLTRTIEQRDNAEQYADALADKIACASGYSVGEHSSANNPWKNALEIELPKINEELIKLSDNVYNHTLSSLQQWIILLGNKAREALPLPPVKGE